MGRYDDSALARVAGKVPGQTLLYVSGYNSDAGTGPEDIWEGGGQYTGHPTNTPQILEVLSSSVNDTSAGTGMQAVTVYSCFPGFWTIHRC